ncbi:Predicted acetyltransferase [Singulisphaera sp. GP187]|uniref:GNAT family N-acetyltransferase n=1 Tax=Singulisphaera sp. GP187 TaxID=1882752 RepID=UPI00092BB588|nr:GNAT family N-acetyltransferase [Singulisphaera sp. GP187]SIN80385.1 Predicted acetyltransferase [Singulisphaera sp. GP187]
MRQRLRSSGSILRPASSSRRRVSKVVVPMKVPSPVIRLPIRRGSVEFCLGTEADHEAVYQSLLHVFHGPDREAYLGALSDPTYRPEQRLLVKVDNRLVSHIHLTERRVRFGSVELPLNGVMWVGTLPEYRGMGFAQNLMRLADDRARETGAAVQALTTGMPQFYRPLGWGVCGRQTFGQTLSRNLPQVSDGLIEGRSGFWNVRPWRQVELNDLMSLYELQYADTTGAVVRSEDYWRWIIGRKYAHVIWVACQGETVRGYAFVKDHKILEIASHPAHPQALKALLGRVRAEALERAYPEVIVHAPVDHPVLEAFRAASGKVIDQEDYEGTCSMYHIPNIDLFLELILPELGRRAEHAGAAVPLELGMTVGDRRWLIHIEGKKSRVEPDKLSRRHLTLSPSTLVRLLMGHCGIDGAATEEGFESSTGTALDAARVLFPVRPIWRSPLDSATA